MPFAFEIVVIVSIGIPFFTGWIRFPKSDPSFLPFQLLLTSGMAHECISSYLIHQGINNTPIYNLALLIQGPVFIWQFYNWQYWGRYSKAPIRWSLSLVLTWLANWLYAGSLSVAFSGYAIVSTLLTAFFAMDMMGNILYPPRPSLHRDARFIICLSAVIFAACAVIIELFWILGFTHDLALMQKTATLFAVINLVINLFYTWAIICIPLRFPFIFRL